MKWILLIFIFAILSSSALADTTFFDQDDAFIMGDSTTSGVIGETTAEGGCRYGWNCTNWSMCFPSGKQTRNCTNTGTCSDTYKSLEIEQNCTYTAPYIAPELEEAKESEKGNVVEEEEETKKQNETEKISEQEIVDKNKTFTYFIIVLTILLSIFYLKKDYFKKIIHAFP